MSAGPMKIGIIGAGAISSQYLDTLTRFPDVIVEFVADLDVERAASQASAYGVLRSGTVEELLHTEDVELVVNLTIPAAHVEVGLRCVEAGKHVWSEKPFALDAESAATLLDAARARGVRAACAPDTFLGPALQTAQRAIADGAIGRPVSALAIFQSAGPERHHPSPEFLFDHGGGPLFDMGPYYLTLLVQFLGSAVRVSAAGSMARDVRTIGTGPRVGTVFPVVVPTEHSAIIEFENGTHAVVIFSFQSDVARSLVEIYGDRGSMRLPNPNGFRGSSLVFGADGAEREIDEVGEAHGRGTGVLELVRAIRAKTPERASGELAAHVLDIMLAIRDSAGSGNTVTITSRVDAPAPVPVSWDAAAATLA